MSPPLIKLNGTCMSFRLWLNVAASNPEGSLAFLLTTEPNLENPPTFLSTSSLFLFQIKHLQWMLRTESFLRARLISTHHYNPSMYYSLTQCESFKFIKRIINKWAENIPSQKMHYPVLKFLTLNIILFPKNNRSNCFLSCWLVLRI